MERIDNVYEVTRRLLGIIDPAGDASVDGIRFENLEQTIDLTESLMADIIYVARHKGHYANSMNIAGERADKFINELREMIIDGKER